MFRFPVVCFLCLILGCGVTLPDADTSPMPADAPQPEPVANFDTSSAAEALAHQAELANDSPAFKASEVLDGILNQGVLPDEFAAKVRSACPVIGTRPATDLSAEQVKAIRNVR